MAETRRRGDALLGAIHAAVLDELADNGYAGLSIERVADRARTGKASIYRRWPTRMELVLDALDHTLPDPEQARAGSRSAHGPARRAAPHRRGHEQPLRRRGARLPRALASSRS